ncbi:MAG: hypothetical protein K6C30_07515, partial [Bacteroidaceae bacterium]|nr:hypothetical protein [Bacteroidaceae bacterium]
MRLRNFIPLLALAPVVLSGCIADEPANAECDIEKCWVHFSNPEEYFYHAYDTLAGQPISLEHPEEKGISTSSDSIIFTIRWDKQVLSPVPLFFQVTEGAKLYQLVEGKEVLFVNGTPVDLTATAVGHYTEQRFVVRSEDGNWSRTYRVSIQVPTMPTYPPEGLKFQFEDYALNSTG